MSGMGSYLQFALGDCYMLSEWLDRDFDIPAIRRAFEKMSPEERARYEEINHDHIVEMIGRTDSQRPPYIRKLGRSFTTTEQGLIVIFTMISLLRVQDTLSLHDGHHRAFHPGSPNRVTCASVYEYGVAMRELQKLEWPSRGFTGSSAGHYVSEDARPSPLPHLRLINVLVRRSGPFKLRTLHECTGFTRDTGFAMQLCAFSLTWVLTPFLT